MFQRERGALTGKATVPAGKEGHGGGRSPTDAVAHGGPGLAPSSPVPVPSRGGPWGTCGLEHGHLRQPLAPLALQPSRLLLQCWLPPALAWSLGELPCRRLLPPTGPGPCPSAGGTELLALSAKGRLLTCRLDPDPDPPLRARGTAADSGRKIKDLLCGIGTASER